MLLLKKSLLLKLTDVFIRLRVLTIQTVSTTEANTNNVLVLVLNIFVSKIMSVWCLIFSEITFGNEFLML